MTIDIEGAQSDAPEPVPEATPDATIESGEKTATIESGNGHDPAEPDTRTVPYAALKEAREAERKWRDQFHQLGGRFDMLERLAKGQQQTTEAVKPAARPDPSVDPVESVKTHEQELAELRQWRQQEEAARNQQLQQERFHGAIEAAEHELRTEAPDYDQAITFLKQSRDSELKAMGYANPRQREGIILYEAQQIGLFALQNNQSPAKAYYEGAKARGYKRQAAAEGDPAARIKAVAQGQQAARTLTGAGGGTAKGMTMEAVASMSKSEFDKWATDENWKKLFGQR